MIEVIRKMWREERMCREGVDEMKKESGGGREWWGGGV